MPDNHSERWHNPAPAGWIWQRPPRTLRWRLSRLVAGALVPLLFLVLSIVLIGHHEAYTRSSQQVEAVARGMALVIERELHAIIASLEVLALSPSLAARDFAAFRREAMVLTLRHYPGSSVALLSPNGDPLLDTAHPITAPFLRSPYLETLHRVVETGQPAVSDLVASPSQGGYTVPIDVPVLDSEGRVWAVLSLAPPLSMFEHVIHEHQPAETWIVAVLDRSGTLVARNTKAERFVGRTTAATLRTAMEGHVEGTVPVQSLEGVPLLTSWSRYGAYGWAVAIGIPQAEITAPLWQALATTLALAALAFAGALALARLEAGRIAGPINRLLRLAALGVTLDGCTPTSLGLREADAVAAALAGAQQDRAEAEAKMLAMEAHSRTELERLVEERTHALHVAQQQLLQSQRLEAVGQLTAGVAHDFNNLLQAQSAGLQLLQRLVRGNGEAERLVERTLATGERGARLTHSLLAFSRKQLLRPEPVGLAATLDTMHEMLSRALTPQVALVLAIDPGVGAVLADPAQLESALLNLCLNARDALHEGGGRIIIAAAPGAAQSEAPNGLAPEAFTLVSVTDDGRGMDEETLARAAEPFFTTKGVGKGSGLGLAMVHGFARQSGGELRMRSTPGQGTRMELWLPRAVEEPAKAPPAPIPAMPTISASLATPARILVVEDEAEVRELIAMLLESAGFEVVEASTGMAAAALLEDAAPFDALVTDCAMPGMSGDELARVAQASWPGLPVLMITGYADIAQVGRVPAAVEVLHKPFRVEELIQRVAAMLAAARAPATAVLPALAGPGEASLL